MKIFGLFCTLGLLAQTASAECIRRQPSLTLVDQTLSAKVSIYAQRFSNGKEYFINAGGYNPINYRAVFRNNDDPSCGGRETFYTNGLDIDDGSQVYMLGSNVKHYVQASPGQSVAINIIRYTYTPMQPETSLNESGSICRQGNVDCTAPVIMTLRALSGPAILTLNGAYPQQGNPAQSVSKSSGRYFNINALAVSPEVLHQIRIVSAPYICDSLGCRITEPYKTLAVCENGATACSAKLGLSKLQIGSKYRIQVTAVNKPDAAGIYYGNQSTLEIEIAP